METVSPGLPAGRLVVPTTAATVVANAAVIATATIVAAAVIAATVVTTVIAAAVVASPVVAAIIISAPESETERQGGITPVVRPRVVIAVAWCWIGVHRRWLSIDWCCRLISGR